jgi:hypothetical protein
MRQRSPKRSVWLYPLGENLFERSELILLDLTERKGKLTPQHKNMNDKFQLGHAGWSPDYDSNKPRKPNNLKRTENMPKEFNCPNSGYDCGYPACAHADQCRKRPIAVQTYTIKEIADYIAGWSMAPYDEVEKIGAATLANALSQLEDDQDGIEAVRQRKIYSENVNVDASPPLIPQDHAKR